MQNADAWKPTKFVVRKGRLIASRDPKHVAVGSRLMSDLIAGTYGDALPTHARGRLLDLGCGAAPLYGTYRNYVSEVICVDWANSLHPNRYIDHECDLSAPLPFHDRAFETILLSDVLEHLPHPELCWSEAARLLTPGGKFILNVPFYYQVHEEPHDYFRYTEFALRRFASDAGFEIVELKAIGGAPEILADLVGKLLSKMPFGSGMASVLQSLTRYFVQTRLGRELSSKTQTRFPLGYFMVAAKPVV